MGPTSFILILALITAAIASPIEENILSKLQHLKTMTSLKGYVSYFGQFSCLWFQQQLIATCRNQITDVAYSNLTCLFMSATLYLYAEQQY